MAVQEKENAEQKLKDLQKVIEDKDRSIEIYKSLVNQISKEKGFTNEGSSDPENTQNSQDLRSKSQKPSVLLNQPHEVKVLKVENERLKIEI